MVAKVELELYACLKLIDTWEQIQSLNSVNFIDTGTTTSFLNVDDIFTERGQDKN